MKHKRAVIKNITYLLTGVFMLWLMRIPAQAQETGTDPAGAGKGGMLVIEGLFKNEGTLTIGNGGELRFPIENSNGNITNSEGMIWVDNGGEISFPNGGGFANYSGMLQVEAGGKIIYGENEEVPNWISNNGRDGEKQATIINRGVIQGRIQNYHEASFTMESGSVVSVENMSHVETGKIILSGGTVERGLDVTSGSMVMTGGTVKNADGKSALRIRGQSSVRVMGGRILGTEEGGAVTAAAGSEYEPGGTLEIGGGAVIDGGIFISEKGKGLDITIGDAVIDGGAAPAIQGDLSGKLEPVTLTVKDGAKISSSSSKGTIFFDHIYSETLKPALTLSLEGGSITNESASGGEEPENHYAALNLGGFSDAENEFAAGVRFDLSGTEVKVKGERSPLVYFRTADPAEMYSGVEGYTSVLRDGCTCLERGTGQAALSVLSEEPEAEPVKEQAGGPEENREEEPEENSGPETEKEIPPVSDGMALPPESPGSDAEAADGKNPEEDSGAGADEVREEVVMQDSISSPETSEDEADEQL